MPKLYALLIGINAYQRPITRLSGCVNDVAQIKTYLEAQHKHFEAILIQELCDEAASKSAIVDSFSTHLGQASTDDVALCYFSGHGTQEFADRELWKEEVDGRLECLVCQDGQLLADKELRWLLGKLTETRAHIVTLFDCCHSGGNTRAGLLADTQGINIKQVSPKNSTEKAFPKRAWEDFIFHDQVDQIQLKTQGIASVFPADRHIQFAACRSDQKAIERNQSGVFTSSLVDFLTKCPETISYYDLANRLARFVKNQEGSQTPQVYSSFGHDALYRGFLNLPVKNQAKVYGNVEYDPALGWIMLLGAIHGISDQNQQFKIVSADEQERYEATASEVMTTSTILELHEPYQLNPEQRYYAYSDDFFSAPILLFLAVNKAKPAFVELVKKRIEQQKNFTLAETPQHADYLIDLDARAFHLQSADYQKDLANPIHYTNSKFEHQVRTYFNYVSNWEFLKNLYNPDAYFLEQSPIKIEFYQVDEAGKEKKLEVINETCEFYPKDLQQNTAIKIKVTNQYSDKLYVAALYLGVDFAIKADLFKDGKSSLNPKESEYIQEGKTFPLNIQRYLLKDNWPAQYSYFKFIATTNDTLEAGIYQQKNLPHPKGRASLDPNEDDFGKVDEWMTRTIAVIIHNPMYRKP